MEDSFVHSVKILLKNIRFIFVFVITGTLLGLLICSPLVIKPKFRSEAIIYPPANTNAKITAEFDLRFGSEKEIDEHIQILNSGILKDAIINKYNLLKHYDIDEDAVDKENKLFKEYDKNISIDKTKFNSISISVLDEDPKIAASIANDLVKIGDEVKSVIVKKNLGGTIEQISNQFIEKKKAFEKLIVEFPMIKESFKGFDLNFNENNSVEKLQADIIIKNNLDLAFKNENEQEIRRLNNLQDVFNEMYELKKTLKVANFNFNSKINGSYIISPAKVADKKTSPVRWLIVVSAFLSSILISISLVLFIDKWKKIKQALN
jgi:uncharacterized protein involved in exopolysaccharide biosynthesis